MIKNQFESISEMMKNASKKAPKIDREAMMKSHRKNMEALTEANKTAIEVMKSIAQLLSQYVKQTFEDFATIMKDTFTQPANGKEAIDKHAEHIKNQFNKALEHGTAITNTLSNSQKEIFDIMHSRAHEHAHESIEAIAKAKATKH